MAKGNIADWQRANLAVLQAQHAHVTRQINMLSAQARDLWQVIEALDDVELDTKPTPATRPEAKRVASAPTKRKHWTQNPPSDPHARRVWQHKLDAFKAKARANAKRNKLGKRGR